MKKLLVVMVMVMVTMFSAILSANAELVWYTDSPSRAFDIIRNWCKENGYEDHLKASIDENGYYTDNGVMLLSKVYIDQINSVESFNDWFMSMIDENVYGYVECETSIIGYWENHPVLMMKSTSSDKPLAEMDGKECYEGDIIFMIICNEV